MQMLRSQLLTASCTIACVHKQHAEFTQLSSSLSKERKPVSSRKLEQRQHRERHLSKQLKINQCSFERGGGTPPLQQVLQQALTLAQAWIRGPPGSSLMINPPKHSAAAGGAHATS